MLFLDPALLPQGPLMAIDPGTKTLGVAVSNTDRTLVTPLTTIQREKFTQDAQALLKLYDERACVGYARDGGPEATMGARCPTTSPRTPPQPGRRTMCG